MLLKYQVYKLGLRIYFGLYVLLNKNSLTVLTISHQHCIDIGNQDKYSAEFFSPENNTRLAKFRVAIDKNLSKDYIPMLSNASELPPTEQCLKRKGTCTMAY